MRPFALSFCLVAILVAGTPASAEDQAQSARQRFTKGAELYRAGRMGEALELFRASLGVYASPNTRLYVARCLRRLGRYAESAIEYERTIREGVERIEKNPRYAAAADAARNELAGIDRRIGRVEIVVANAPQGMHVTLDGREVEPDTLKHPIPATPGPVEVSATAPGFKEARAKAQVVAGEVQPVSLTLAPESPVAAEPEEQSAAPAEDPKKAVPKPVLAATPRRRSFAVPAWISVGVSAASFAAFAAGFAITDGTFSALERECVYATCTRARFNSIRSSGETTQAVTNISLGLGIAAAGAAAVLFTLDARPVRPRVGKVEVQGLGIGGTF